MHTFKTLGLKDSILKGIEKLGFEQPTPIQEKTIPLLINQKTDLVGLAQTGTGKTAAFGLPICHLIDFNQKYTQALIICPTRELCLQITRDLQNFILFEEKAKVVAIYGGASIDNQIRDISRGAHIIVATPGRMVDMIHRRKVSLSDISIVVLDEADEMLNMGFKEDLDIILQQTPSEKNTWLFSATMPQEVLRISRNYMSNPQEITIGKQNSGALNIDHHFYVVQARDRYLALKRIVDYYPDIFGIIFCRTRMETQEIAEKLMKDGYNADALHGDLSQAQRDYVMSRYRNKSLQMLVATDVAARGIDVNNVTHVINYNLPDDVENYTHRSGRTARAGKSGISITLVNSRELGKIKEIERKIGSRFTRKLIPNGSDVCEKQLFSLVKKIHDSEVREEEISDFLPPITEMLKDLSKEELIKKMVSTDFNRFLNYYQNAPDLNVSTEPSRVKTGSTKEFSTSSSNRGKRNDTVSGRYFINIGEIDGISKMELIDFISSTANIRKNDIQKLDFKSNFSFFNVSDRNINLVKAFTNKKFNGRKIRIDNAEDKFGGNEREQRGERRERGERNDRRDKPFKKSFQKSRPF